MTDVLPRRVLVIDDDVDFAHLVRALLRHVVSQVLIETSSLAGMAAVRAKRPDLILCDVDMPTMNGFELRRRLVEDATLADVPFMFLSGRTGATEQLQGLRLGATDYIVKPIQPDVLVARVVHALERTRKAPEKAPHLDSLAGDLTVVPMADLVQLLEAGNASGVLELAGGGLFGRLVLSHGVVVGAHANEQSGEDAALLLVALAEGRFRFAAGPIAKGSTLALRVGPLLMDAAWIQDELEHLGAHAPRVDDAIGIVKREAAEALFKDRPGWRTVLEDRRFLRVSRVAELLGMGTLRARVLLGQAVQQGTLRII